MKAHSPDEVLVHPRFVHTRNASINEFADLFTSSHFLTRLITDSGCLMLTVVLVGFHANHDDGDPASWTTPGMGDSKSALDRARAQCGTEASIDVSKIDAFARLMNERLINADTNARKAVSARSSMRSKSMIRPSGSLAAEISCKPPLPANRSRTEMFVVL
jgi:hypothetical protein